MEKYSWGKQQSERRELRRPKRKKISDNTKKELKIYKVLSADYLKDHPICECGRLGCLQRSEEVHHKKWRGKYLNVVEFFLAVARNCHIWIEAHPNEAKLLGLSLSRLSK